MVFRRKSLYLKIIFTKGNVKVKVLKNIRIKIHNVTNPVIFH